jgi:proline iminopeptidase
VTPRQDTVTVNGVQLFTRTVGDGPPVVVLHGGPGAHHDYLLPQFDALAHGRALHYYDQRGGGQSPVDRDVPVGWESHVADLDALREHWRFDTMTLLGYSWGALLSLLYAVRFPARIARLALVSPAASSRSGRDTFERRFAERMRAPAVVEARRTLHASDLRERDPAAYRQRTFELAVAGYFRDPQMARHLTPFRVTARTQDEVWNSLDGFDLRERLPELAVPALVAHGAHDPIPIETAEETARLLGAAFERFDASGHVPHVEEFDRFVAVLDAFLPRAA